MSTMSGKQVQNLASKWKLEVCATKGGWRPPTYACEPPGYVAQTSGGAAHHSAAGAVASASDSSAGSRSESAQQQQHLLSKRAWDVALAPLKSLPMNMFVMYMSGNSISIFPIMMVCMMAWRPLKAILAVNQAFKGLEEQLDSVLLQKLVYTLGNALAIAIAVYKCHSIGLLPTHASDWLDFVQPPDRLEYAVAAAPPFA